MFAAEWGTGEVLISMLWFFFIFIWIMLLFYVFADLFSNHEMGGLAKLLWVVVIIIAPYLGVFVYLLVNGSRMGQRQAAAMQVQQAQMDSYIRQTASSGTVAEQLKQLSDLNDAGKLSDEEFASMKGKVVSA